MRYLAICTFCSLALIGCSDPPNYNMGSLIDAGAADTVVIDEHLTDISIPSVQDRIINESLQHWDNVVGFRDKSIHIEVTRKQFDFGGTCLSNGEDRFIEVYLNNIDNNPDEFRAIFLHELAHAHLTCSAEDHINQSESILSTELEATEIDQITLDILNKHHSVR